MTYPIITGYDWGWIKIAYAKKSYQFGGKSHERADLVLFPNGHQKWNWKNKNTLCEHHNPGVTKQAIQFLVDKGCNIIIITKGYGDPSFKTPGLLQTQNNVKKYFREKGITIYNIKSEYAVNKWNNLIKKNNKVGMLFHSTC